MSCPIAICTFKLKKYIIFHVKFEILHLPHLPQRGKNPNHLLLIPCLSYLSARDIIFGFSIFLGERGVLQSCIELKALTSQSHPIRSDFVLLHRPSRI